MSLQAIIVDSRPAYLRCARPDLSLTLAPLGTGTVIQHIWAQLQLLEVQDLCIVPDFEPASEYRQALEAVAADVQVRSAQQFADLLELHEPADLLLIVDPRLYPAGGYELTRLLHEADATRLPQHLTQLRHTAQGACERVVYEPSLRVRCIQRLYDGVTQVEALGVSAAVLAVAVARNLEPGAGLFPDQVRRQLGEARIPTRDVPACGLTFDLASEAGLLALNQHFLVGRLRARRPGARPPAPEYSIWAGCDTWIDPSSRLYGPIVLHPGAQIGSEAVVIGPAVLGAQTQVGRAALVCQCVLAPGARIAGGQCLISRVWTGGDMVTALRPAAQQSRVPLDSDTETATDRRRRHSRAVAAAPCPGGRWYPAVKRSFDFVAALAGLAVLAPLLLATGALIKLTSRGPALFGHEREGRAGQPFRCWKFRTMVDRAHSQQRALYVHSTVDGPQFKIPHDPRVTRLGRWLRATNIDELPQLYNVLRGDMSLIGPRPSPFRENQICIPWRQARLAVRPGITGLWQVCRRERALGDFHQWIYFDVLYVRHLSLWLDLRVLLATFLTMGGRWSVPLWFMIPRAGMERTATALAPDWPARRAAASPAAAKQRIAPGPN